MHLPQWCPAKLLLYCQQSRPLQASSAGMTPQCGSLSGLDHTGICLWPNTSIYGECSTETLARVAITHYYENTGFHY